MLLVTIINFLLSLSLLIVLHELGHFIPARLFKTRVEKFFLFFDVKFSLFKKKIGETVYGIGWLPLGGYVKIAGMIDESMDKEQMQQEPQPWEFRTKPAWQRLIIMLGGVIVNVLVGFIILIALLYFNGTKLSTGDDFKNGFGFSKTLEDIGFQQGDKILMIDNDTIDYAPLLNHRLIFRGANSVTVKRDGELVTIDNIPDDIGSRMFNAGVPSVSSPRRRFIIDSIAPGSIAAAADFKPGSRIVKMAGRDINFTTDYDYALNNDVVDDKPFVIVLEQNGFFENKTITFNREEDKTLGIYRGFTEKDDITLNSRTYSIGAAVAGGLDKGYWTMREYINQFKYLFTAKGAGQLGGFGTIAKLYPDSFDWVKFWGTTAFISFILAIMNILPIPALDGGHVMFLLYEIITGRKPGDKFLERAQIVGILLLLTLMVYANGNDLYKWIMERFFS